MQKQKRVGFIMGISAAVLWGTFGIFSVLLSNFGLSEGTVSLISPLFLLLFFSILTAKEGLGNFKVARGLVPILLLDGISSAVYNYSAVQAYSYLPIAVVSTLVYCNLFLLIIVSRLVFKTSITWQKILAVCAAIIGIAMVVNLFGVDTRLSTIGLLWGLAAMVSWSSLVTCEKYLMTYNVDGNAVIAYEGFFSLIFISAFMNSPVQAVTDIAKSFVTSGGLVILPILGFGLLTTVICYWLYINALNRLEPAYVQIAYTMDPVTSCILGLLLFGQALLPVQIAGIVLILVVVIWIQWIERDKGGSEEAA